MELCSRISAKVNNFPMDSDLAEHCNQIIYASLFFFCVENNIIYASVLDSYLIFSISINFKNDNYMIG